MSREKITVKEAVKLSGKNRQAIYAAIADGKIQASRPGGFELWIDRASLLAYLSVRQAKTKTK